MTEEAMDPATNDDDMLGPGAILRQAREDRGLSIAEVARSLKLAPRQISAIEDAQFELLPGATFARGFVRNYARLMQLDAEPLLIAVDHQVARGEVELAPLSNATGTLRSYSSVRSVPRALVVVLLGVTAALATVAYLERSKSPSSVAAPSAAIAGSVQNAVAAVVPTGPVLQKADPPAPAAASHHPDADKVTPSAQKAPEIDKIGGAVEPSPPAAAAPDVRKGSVTRNPHTWLKLRFGNDSRLAADGARAKTLASATRYGLA